MANMVMEQLLPSLEKDMLPGLKAKKTERKRVWFAVSHLCLQLMQFLRNIGFHFPAVERKNEWKSVFQGYIWKSRALIHYSWSLRALFCTLGSHFYFLKKSWNSFKKRKNKKKTPIFFMNLLPSDGGGSIYPGPGGHVWGAISIEGGMSGVCSAARGADSLRHGPDPQLKKAARGKNPRYSHLSDSLVT